MTTSTAHSVFPKLANPSQYRACQTDLLVDDAARAYWLDLFESHFDFQLQQARSFILDPRSLQLARDAMSQEMELLRQRPDRLGRLDIIVLDEIRQSVLDQYGIEDEFRTIKQRENVAALAELPKRLHMLDSIAPARRLEPLVHGMLAGNLFDLGVKATADTFAQGSIAWQEAWNRIPARPWFIDHLRDAQDDWERHVHRKAIIFVDNAGADIVLGVLPLARELLMRGTDVVLTANDKPVLNDVTVTELRDLLQRAANLDETFAARELRVVPNGHASPLIDLKRISHELAACSREADLVIMVGMGRTIESNFTVSFTCHGLFIAMIKDPMVARSIGAQTFDAVVRYEPA